MYYPPPLLSELVLDFSSFLFFFVRLFVLFYLNTLFVFLRVIMFSIDSDQVPVKVCKFGLGLDPVGYREQPGQS